MLNKCAICGGELKKDTTTLTFDRENKVIVIRNVPALVCSNCGESYFDAETTRKLEKIKEEAQHSGVEFSVIRYEMAKVTT